MAPVTAREHTPKPGVNWQPDPVTNRDPHQPVTTDPHDHNHNPLVVGEPRHENRRQKRQRERFERKNRERVRDPKIRYRK